MCTCFKKDIKATRFLGLQKNCGLKGGEACKGMFQKLNYVVDCHRKEVSYSKILFKNKTLYYLSG